MPLSLFAALGITKRLTAVPSLASLPKQKLNSLNAYSFYQPQ
jgi:hypothetical protein